MILHNRTPLAAMRFANSDPAGREFGVAIIKAALDIGADGACHLADEQEPFNFGDVPHGALNASSLRYPSDLVAYKPATDIIVDATARAPGGRPAGRWDAGLRVGDALGQTLEKRVRIVGPRHWQPIWRRPLSAAEAADWRSVRRLFDRWSLGEAEPIAELPIRYEFAYGGTLDKGVDEDGKPVLAADHRNPVGRGWIDPEWTDHAKPVPAPQIEESGPEPGTTGAQAAPAGLGPIFAAWLPRRSLGGTFDENWQKTIWPRWPPDYDFLYNNSAPAGLRHAPHLRGALAVDLLNLRPDGEPAGLRIPDITPIVGVRTQAGATSLVRPHLDTVVLDIAADALFDCRVLLTWRMPFNRVATSSLTVMLPERAERDAFEARITDAGAPDACATPSKLLECPA